MPPMPGPMPPPPMTPAGPMPGRPATPGNPMAGPAGPGASPMTAPGPGAGNEAATDALVSGVMQTLYKALQAYPLGSKKQQAVLNAVRALTANFAKQENAGLVPASIQQMAMNAKPGGGPLGSAPPAPIAPAPPPGLPRGGPPGAPPGGGEEMAA